MVMALSPMESVYLPALVFESPRRASTTLLAPNEARIAKRNLLVQDLDASVCLAIERQRKVG